MSTVLVRCPGDAGLMEIDVDPASVPDASRVWAIPTQGTVVGVLLNDHDALGVLADDFDHAPYHAPPRLPVLYLKPANTWVGHGATVTVPGEITGVEVGASVGLVIGRSMTRVSASQALDHVTGCVVVADLCEAHESVFRPAIRERCRDGFCAFGPWIMPMRAVRSPDALVLRTYVNGQLRAEATTAHLVRNTARLLSDISDFMTLASGDVVLLGPGADRPQARPGDNVRIDVPGVGMLENRFVAEPDWQGRAA